jgi:DNA mismatch repair protein MutL
VARLATEEARKEEARDRGWKILGQYLNFYIIVSDQEGLLIIDQHNAHERVLYEKYLALERQRGFARRQSLFPLILELSPAEMVRFEENRALLEEFGFELENLGGRSLLLRCFPDFLEEEEARQIFLAFLGEAEGASSPELKPRFLATMACKTAIKAGVALTLEKMEYLVSELFQCEHPWICPHGRPTALRLSLENIEKGLGRS